MMDGYPGPEANWNGDMPWLRLLYAQSVHETGHFTSGHFNDHKNLFGMHASVQRGPYYDYTYAGDGGTMAGYYDVVNSLKDRYDWYLHNTINDPRLLPSTDSEQDVREMASAIQEAGYHPLPDYVNRITATYESLFGFDNWVSGNEDTYSGGQDNEYEDTVETASPNKGNDGKILGWAMYGIPAPIFLGALAALLLLTPFGRKILRKVGRLFRR